VGAVDELLPAHPPMLTRDDEPRVVFGDRRGQNLWQWTSPEAGDVARQRACDERVSPRVALDDPFSLFLEDFESGLRAVVARRIAMALELLEIIHQPWPARESIFAGNHMLSVRKLEVAWRLCAKDRRVD